MTLTSKANRVRIDYSNFLKQLFDLEQKRVYGKKYADRKQEPSMFELLSGGFEAPVENDYTKSCFQRGDKPIAKKNLEDKHDVLKGLLDKVKDSKLVEKIKNDLIYRIRKADSQYVSEAHDNYRQYIYDSVLNSFLYN